MECHHRSHGDEKGKTLEGSYICTVIFQDLTEVFGNLAKKRLIFIHTRDFPVIFNGSMDVTVDGSRSNDSQNFSNTSAKAKTATENAHTCDSTKKI